jgi:hypothetical protein
LADTFSQAKTRYSGHFGISPIEVLEKHILLRHSNEVPHNKGTPGYWLGVAHNGGDALAYVILTADTRQIIERCVICSADDPKTQNKDITFDPELEPVSTENKDNKSVQIPEMGTEQPRQSSPTLNTLKKQHHHSHQCPNTDPEQPIRNDGDNEDQDFSDPNMTNPEVDYCRDPSNQTGRS